MCGIELYTLLLIGNNACHDSSDCIDTRPILNKNNNCGVYIRNAHTTFILHVVKGDYNDGVESENPR